MPSLYARYILEREGKSIIEDERGFATYSFLPDLRAVYIEDIFVDKAFRNQNVASEYADQIATEAKSKNYKQLIGSVDPRAIGATSSLKVLLAYGFQLDSVAENLIYFKKQIDT
ncbi:MAG: GNAT family N-acetyltransferase [Candidatus Paceibacterota bacterium]